MLNTSYLGPNVTDPALGDKRVRQAPSLAINRDVICETIYQGTPYRRETSSRSP